MKTVKLVIKMKESGVMRGRIWRDEILKYDGGRNFFQK